MSESVQLTFGVVSLTGQPYNFWAGDNLSLHDGVFRYWRRARQSVYSFSEWLFQDVAISFFIDFTVALILPLLCG